MTRHAATSILRLTDNSHTPHPPLVVAEKHVTHAVVVTRQIDQLGDTTGGDERQSVNRC
jgi:hypothetical protein